MKESIANALILNIVIVFIVILIFFFAGSLSYSKAFKVKNRIVDIIEKYEDYNSTAIAEIADILKNMGYRVNSGNKSCPIRNGKTSISASMNAYRYCIYKYDTPKGNYFGVTAYMYFDFPIIGNTVEFPVYGETKILKMLREE